MYIILKTVFGVISLFIFFCWLIMIKYSFTNNEINEEGNEISLKIPVWFYIFYLFCIFQPLPVIDLFASVFVLVASCNPDKDKHYGYENNNNLEFLEWITGDKVYRKIKRGSKFTSKFKFLMKKF